MTPKRRKACAEDKLYQFAEKERNAFKDDQ